MTSELNHSTSPPIEAFTGDTLWLSNFYQGWQFVYDGTLWPTGEHAFQGLKTHDPALRADIAAALTPGAAKGLGRVVPLRPDWEAVKGQVMLDVVTAKFAEPEMRDRLLATGDALLVEGNPHHDQVWGCCTCDKHRPWPGKNWLGKALMHLRMSLDGSAGTFPRVAVTGHRPQHMTDDQMIFAAAELRRLAYKLKADYATTVAVSGMSIGSDTLWAQAALAAGLDLWAYIPFEGQPAKWREADKEQWESLRRMASREIVLGEKYDVRLLHARNDFMIRDASLLICVFDPTKTTGGTASAMAKAHALGVPLVKVNIVDKVTTFAVPAA